MTEQQCWYRQELPRDLRKRLREIGDVLCFAREAKYSLGELGNPQDDAPASYDSQILQPLFGRPQQARRGFFLADLWLMEASHHLAAMGTLYHRGDVVFGPLPLARTILELSARVAYVLDPSVGTRERAARALIEEAFSTQELAKAEKRIHGPTSQFYQGQRARVKELRLQATEVFGSGAEGGPHEWTLEGQQLISPTVAVEQLGNITGLGRLFVGLYDRLSTHTHPSLGSTLFLDRDESGTVTGLSIRPEDLDGIANNALAAFYVALEHFVRYAGWQTDAVAFDEFADRLATTFPGFFTS